MGPEPLKCRVQSSSCPRRLQAESQGRLGRVAWQPGKAARQAREPALSTLHGGSAPIRSRHATMNLPQRGIEAIERSAKQSGEQCHVGTHGSASGMTCLVRWITIAKSHPQNFIQRGELGLWQGSDRVLTDRSPMTGLDLDDVPLLQLAQRRQIHRSEAMPMVAYSSRTVSVKRVPAAAGAGIRRDSAVVDGGLRMRSFDWTFQLAGVLPGQCLRHSGDEGQRHGAHRAENPDSLWHWHRA